MGKRYTIGLIYTIDQNWIAGTYYIENLVSALKTLPEQDQPILKIYCYNQEEFDVLVKKTGYENCSPAFLKNVNSWLQRAVNKISTVLFNTHWFTGGTFKDVDLIFPNPNSYHFTRIKNKLFWIPDFQHKHYPNFFSDEQLTSRTNEERGLINHRSEIVFSSEHARNGFLALYPNAKNKLYVMQFAVTLPNLSYINLTALLTKYELPNDYFICSNQFWAHKNHQVVLRALRYLKDDNCETMVVFTGKPYDNRNPDYYESIMKLIKENDLESNVMFLGFIPREEQLVLMHGSLSIIQPSLFEGWSTVVEDAKSLNKNIIVSDIPVHREQLPAHNFFFNPHDEVGLSQNIKRVLSEKEIGLNLNYSGDVVDFGRKFMDIVKTHLK